ncbi:MAG: hypothetical protein EXR72_21285 [Myxococcales bacterium]|nr:hypothetical protein [Myxococcales bacterium]
MPVGRFNLAHDSPRYDLVDRPLVSTRIIPSTWSDIGGGLFGALYPGRHKLTYEVYLLNGLGDGLLAGAGTRLPEGRGPDRFAEDNNGSPGVAARVAWDPPFKAEVGLSFYTGLYNRTQQEGVTIDRGRLASLIALDLDAQIGPVTLRGEGAVALIDVPEESRALHARMQAGGFLELSARLVRRRMLAFEAASLYAVVRLDYIDLDVGRRRATGERVGDESARISVGLSFRPAPVTSLRLCYDHTWTLDPLNNVTRSGAIQLGVASYF